MPDAIRHLPETASGLEIVRALVAAMALSYSTAALSTAYRYYRHRRELTNQDAVDFVLLDVRVAGVITAAAFYLTVVGILSLFNPPPRGQGAYNAVSLIVFFLSLALSSLIMATKIANRRVRSRIHHRLEGLSLEQARILTRDERHNLKDEIHRLGLLVEERDREIDRLEDENHRLRRGELP